MKRLAIDLGAPGAGRYADDLERAGLFLPGEDGELDTEWEVVFTGGDLPVGVIARVVFADATGVGLQLMLGPAVRDRLAALATAAPPDDGRACAVVLDVPDDDAGAGAEDDGGAEDSGADADGGADAAQRKVPRNVYERLRGLTLNQQHKFAREGELPERIALERIYGKTVWELLLRNQRISAPEVARLARKGNLPRPLLEIIVGNGTWLGVPEIRRALLANPRLSPELIPRVLRHLPRAELKLVPNQLAYPALVREAARRMLKTALGREP